MDRRLPTRRGLGAGLAPGLAPMGRRPGFWVLEEGAYFTQARARQVAALLGEREGVPPGGERVQFHAVLGERRDALGENAVV